MGPVDQGAQKEPKDEEGDELPRVKVRGGKEQGGPEQSPAWAIVGIEAGKHKTAKEKLFAKCRS